MRATGSESPRTQVFSASAKPPVGGHPGVVQTIVDDFTNDLIGQHPVQIDRSRAQSQNAHPCRSGTVNASTRFGISVDYLNTVDPNTSVRTSGWLAA